MDGKKAKGSTTLIVTDRERMGRIFEAQSGMKNQPYLRCTAGKLKGKSFLLGVGELNFGRAGGCSIVLEDPAVSSRHATVFSRDEQFLIRDEQSTNGTFINDKQVEQAQLANGDVIRMGQTTWQVVLPQR
jgi:pSer/pThr/pTyr-binding forkhead associated (FHA) protein